MKYATLPKLSKLFISAISLQVQEEEDMEYMKLCLDEILHVETKVCMSPGHWYKFRGVLLVWQVVICEIYLWIM